ncbi:MAG: hypothetical protein WBA18_10675, partial [Terracidiphilus sp.]
RKPINCEKTVLPSFIPSSWEVGKETGTHFKSRQAKNVYNMLVLCRLQEWSITFTGQPWTHNFGYRQQISVPVKGEYYLRIGMLDRTSGNMGAIEVPVATVAKLPPAGAAAASKPPAK